MRSRVCVRKEGNDETFVAQDVLLTTACVLRVWVLTSAWAVLP